MMKLGCHVSFKAKKYLAGAAQEALSYNATAMMIYLGAPQNTRRIDPQLMQLEAYEKNYASSLPKTSILVHAPYIVNPASVNKHQFAIKFLVEEIKIMNFLGLKQLVLHPGAHTKYSRAESLETLVFALKEILKKTINVEILLETMAGKGTELGNTFEELKYIIDQVNSPRLGICLDTCHIWDAGYDVNNHQQLMQRIKKAKILSLIKAIHINDSKNMCGARKDRHANLKQGHIDVAALKQIVHAPEFANIIKVLETPWVNNHPIYKSEIELLK